MEYAHVGSGLLLPGLGCDQRLWAGVAQPLSERFTIVQPRTWGQGTLAERASQLETLSRAWAGGPVGIAGLSMGGYLAFECLRRWPQGIRAAALLDTTAYPDGPDRVQTRQQVLRLIEQNAFAAVLDAFVTRVLAPGAGVEHPARRLLLTMGRSLGATTFAADVRAILERGGYTDVLRAIRVPALFAAGAADTLTPPAVARSLADQVPGSWVTEVPDSGHMTPLENPGFMARLLGGFFASAFGI